MDYSIIDLVGKIVITGKGTKDNNEIDISFLPKGIYIFRVGEESIKWVKQ